MPYSAPSSQLARRGQARPASPLGAAWVGAGFPAGGVRARGRLPRDPGSQMQRLLRRQKGKTPKTVGSSD